MTFRPVRSRSFKIAALKRAGAALVALACGFTMAPAAMAEVPIPEMAGLMQESGSWNWIDEFGRQQQAEIPNLLAQWGRMPKAELPKARRSLHRLLSPDRLKALMVGATAANTRPEDLAALQAWVRSDAGRRVARSFAQPADPRPHAVRLREASQHLDTASESRRALIQQIARLSETAEFLVAVEWGSALAALEAANSALDGALTSEIAKIGEEYLNQRVELLHAAEKRAAVGVALQMSDLSDEDLHRYAAFLSSPVGSRVTKVTRQSFESSVFDTTGEAWRLIVLRSKAMKCEVAPKAKWRSV